MSLVRNVKRSFAGVRKDILELKNDILKLAEKQQELVDILRENKQENNKTKRVKIVRPKTAKRFVAAKEGKKFHIPECPYAQNIKPRGLVKFKTKDSALNKGYKPCSCVK
jgi:16S rRNA G966 N2-methylase RsmD